MTQIKDASLDNVSFLQSNLENEIQNIKQLEYNLMSDFSLQNLIIRYSDAPKYEYYTLIASVQQRLQIMKNSNNYIQDVLVYIPGMGHTISASSGYLDLDKAAYRRLLNTQFNAKYPLIIDDSGIFCMVLFPLDSYTGTPPVFLVDVVLDRDKLRAFLGKFRKYNGSDTALYDYTSGNWLYSIQSNINHRDNTKPGLIADAGIETKEATEEIGGKEYYEISNYSRYLNTSFVQYVPMEAIFSIPNQYSRYLWYYVALSLLVILVYSYSTYKFVKYPINIILKSFKSLEEGDLGAHVQLRAANEFNVLFEGFNKMVYRLNELIDRVFRQELYTKKAELKQLQSQINPHFLYNSYFMLHRMIKDNDKEDAVLLSSYLGNYFKYITRDGSEEVPLRKEFEHAYSYAQIQQMRFSGRLSLDFGAIPEKYLEAMVLRMILQPILENSFEHGIKSAAKNNRVRVEFKDTGTGLVIIVEDTGESLQEEDIAALQSKLSNADNAVEITGILNVHRRMLLRYGPESGISVSRSTLGGLKIEMLIFPG